MNTTGIYDPLLEKTEISHNRFSPGWRKYTDERVE
jgi:hypothetical protein